DIDAVLRAAGSARDLVLRVECYLADAADFDEWNGIWCAHFKPPRPARTTVVTGFVIPEMLIEPQVTAIPGPGDPAGASPASSSSSTSRAWSTPARAKPTCARSSQNSPQ